MKKTSWYDYIDWLIYDILNSKREYYSFLLLLSNIEFIYSIPRDRNRYMDGIYLRERYSDELFEDIPCTVLEMLIALAIRCEQEYIGDPAAIDPSRIFWEMIFNLGFSKKIIKGDMTIAKENYIQRKIDSWLYREITFFGEGGIFPLREPCCDQREIEIWSQMMGYITENYT